MHYGVAQNEPARSALDYWERGEKFASLIDESGSFPRKEKHG